MAMERRGRGTYYYKKVRQGSRVRSVYAGRGQVAHLSYLLDQQEVSAKTADISFVHRSYEFDASARQWITGAMHALGYYRHNRGEWRRMKQEIVPAEQSLPAPKPGNFAFAIALMTLLESVKFQDPDLVPQMKRFVQDRVKQIKADGDSPIEDVLARRIALAELRVQILEMRASQPPSFAAECKLLEEVHRANLSLIHACKALASVRRLPNLTLVQVNSVEPK